MVNSGSRWGVVRVVAGFTVGSHLLLLFSKEFTLLQGKMLLLARPNGNASRRKKKGLLIGINYKHAPDLQLQFPQRDMMKFYALLKGEIISQYFVRLRR